MTLVRLQNLPAMDMDGLSDPYVTLQALGQRVRSSTKRNSLNPEFDEKFVFDEQPLSDLQTRLGSEMLHMRVVDSDGNLDVDDFVCGANVALHSFKLGDKPREIVVPMVTRGGKNVSAIKHVGAKKPVAVLRIAFEARGGGSGQASGCCHVSTMKSMQEFPTMSPGWARVLLEENRVDAPLSLAPSSVGSQARQGIGGSTTEEAIAATTMSALGMQVETLHTQVADVKSELADMRRSMEANMGQIMALLQQQHRGSSAGGLSM